jgi:DnaJ-class molecular chaperone
MAIDFQAIDEARKTLGLDSFASQEEIRSAYKKLAAELHPDRHASSTPEARAAAEERFKKVSHANDVLTEYCARYLYSFKEDDVKRSLVDPETRAHLKRYYDGMWGHRVDL